MIGVIKMERKAKVLAALMSSVLLVLAFLPAMQIHGLDEEIETGIVRDSSVIELDPEIVYPYEWTYHDYLEVTHYLYDLEGAYPEIVDVYSIGQSVQGRELWCIEFGEGPTGVLIDGGIHGDEAIATEAVLYFATLLLDNQENKTVSGLLDSRTFYMIPLVNPDGLERSEYLGYLGRYNARFVDLNRDYIDPISQPETRAVAAFMDEHNFSVYLNVHSGGYNLLYPWGYASGNEPFEMPEEHEAVYEFVGQWMTQNTDMPEYYIGPSVDVMYEAVGCADDYSYQKHLVPSFTYEVYSLTHWLAKKVPGTTEDAEKLLSKMPFLKSSSLPTMDVYDLCLILSLIPKLPFWILSMMARGNLMLISLLFRLILPPMWSLYNPPESDLPIYMPGLMPIMLYCSENAEALGNWDLEELTQ